MEKVIDPGSGDAPPDISDELPLMVWLNGDEPFFGDFIVDAEGAMKQLGIKRSRLTQISGHELRVGKVRIDRYTRALYRLKDVEAYRAWTRRTASHQKSAEVVKDAALRLDAVREELSGNFTLGLGLSEETWLKALGSEARALRQQNISGFSSIERHIAALRSLIMTVKNHGLQESAAIKDREKQFDTRFRDLGNSLALLSEMVLRQESHLSQLHAEQREYSHRLNERLENDAARLTDSIHSSSLRLFAEFELQLKALELNVLNANKTLEEPLPEPLNQRPERRPPVNQRKRQTWRAHEPINF